MSKTTHELLMIELRKYFEFNQDFESTETHASGMRARKSLSAIRILASTRRNEIQEIRQSKEKIPVTYQAESLKKANSRDRTKDVSSLSNKSKDI